MRIMMIVITSYIVFSKHYNLKETNQGGRGINDVTWFAWVSAIKHGRRGVCTPKLPSYE